MITQFGRAGISMILDKSAFQSFNNDQIVQLHRYYWLNITPILVMEVLGDLKKDIEPGVINSEKVAELSKKLSSFNSSINSHYSLLIQEELTGKLTIPFYTPLIDTGVPVKMQDGNTGIWIEPSIERKSINRWKEKDFNDIDKYLSKLWRDVTLKPDTLTNIKELLKKEISEFKVLTKQTDIIDFLNASFNNPDLHLAILELLVLEFSLSSKTISEIFYRWETFDEKNLHRFAPYSMFCLKAKLFFYICLQNVIIGTRPTNLLDLDYVYYLPFCRVFVSNDKFHKQIVPYLITQDQLFIKGKELKSDLIKIQEIKDKLSDDELKRTHSEPPRVKELITYKIWNQMLKGWPPVEDWTPSDFELNMANEMITKMRHAKPSK
jgi:hypothetical protein